MKKLVFISDTHEQQEYMYVPNGDILVHSGDATWNGNPKAIIKFNEWLGKLPHKHKIFVPGNHDWLFYKEPNVAKELLTNAKVLIDEAYEVEGIKFYGSPWTPVFGSWAFMKPPGSMIKAVWDAIPEGTDVLITHGPPKGTLDVVRPGSVYRDNVGCADLAEAVARIKPKIHAFGHIHDSNGACVKDGITYINAAMISDKLDIQKAWEMGLE